MALGSSAHRGSEPQIRLMHTYNYLQACKTMASNFAEDSTWRALLSHYYPTAVVSPTASARSAFVSICMEFLSNILSFVVSALFEFIQFLADAVIATPIGAEHMNIIHMNSGYWEMIGDKTSHFGRIARLHAVCWGEWNATKQGSVQEFSERDSVI